MLNLSFQGLRPDEGEPRPCDPDHSGRNQTATG